VRDALSNEGVLANRTVVSFFLFQVKYVAPVIIFVILLRGLKLI
jgi:hypothetical protein